MNRTIALVVVALALALTAPVVAQKRQAPCPPFCDPPVVSWYVRCVNPNSTVIRAPLNAQWVTFGNKLCFVVPDERPIE